MTKQNSNGTTPSRRKKTERTALGGASGILIIAIILFVQYGLGIDILNVDEEAEVPTAAPPVDLGEITPVTLQPIPGGYDGEWFQLYFTEPINSTNKADFTGAPIENALVAAIDEAQQRIDATLFEMNSEPVAQALIAAHERGVQVRIVADDEHGFDIIESPDSLIFDLEDAGIPVVADDHRSSGYLMHNKFFVFDGQKVWTGSTNITNNGMYNNNNNALLIRSARLAQYYTAEFEEMFNDKKFGKTSPVETDLVVNIDGTLIEVYFESEGEAGQRLWELIRDAHTVRFMAFSFTDSLVWTDSSDGESYSVMGLLRDRAAAGAIEWQGIIEASSRSFTKPLYCVDSQRMRQDGNPDILHHKVFIIDDSIVVTGSFNFSNSAATRNDENLLIIHSESIANAYLSEFAKRWRESQEMPASAFDC